MITSMSIVSTGAHSQSNLREEIGDIETRSSSILKITGLFP
jgi:hypothetical protein